MGSDPIYDAGLLGRHPPDAGLRLVAVGDRTRGRLAFRTPAALLDRVEGGEPRVSVPALPLELGLAVGVVVRDAAAAALGRHGVQRGDGVAQLLVGAALAPMPLADRVRHRAPAVPLRA